MTETPAPSPEEFRDLGFGSVVATKSRLRLLNRDGSFNTARQGLGLRSSLSLYNTLLTMSWPAFLLLVVALYCVANLLFAAAYVACGPGALEGPPVSAGRDQFLQAFFFSVHTISTVGYGHIVPVTLAAPTSL